MPRSKAGQRRPRTKFQEIFGKFKLWVWNSYRTFMEPFRILNRIVFFIIGQILPILFSILGAIIGGLLGKLIGFLIPIPSLGLLGMIFDGPGLIGAAIGVAIAGVLAFVPSIVVFLSSAVLHIATMLTVGVVGAAVGLVTSFGLLFKNPHTYWLRKDAAAGEAAAAKELAAVKEANNQEAYAVVSNFIHHASTTAVQVADVTSIVSNNYKTPPAWFTRFETFDPNQGLTSVANSSQRNPVRDLTGITVVKASNGKYYDKAELDRSKQEGRNSNVKYNLANDVVPEELKKQFKENVTDCAFIQDGIPISKENALRSRYGYYYNKANIEREISISHRCPNTGYFLDNTPKYLQPVDKSIAPRPVAPPAPSMCNRFANFFTRRNVVVPNNANPSSIVSAPGSFGQLT